MAPFWQVKESKYYLDKVQAKLSQHMLFYLRLKAWGEKKKKKIHPAIACEVCHLLRKAQHSNTRKKEVKKKLIMLKLLDIIALIDSS